MIGEYQHSLDSKGRLFIPARLREELGSEFFVTLSMDRCLNAYSTEDWERFQNRVRAMSYSDQHRMRTLFAMTNRCELDSQGRVLLPQNLRDKVGLVKNVTVLGCIDHAEFWDSDAWSSVREVESSPENIFAVMQELGF